MICLLSERSFSETLHISMLYARSERLASPTMQKLFKANLKNHGILSMFVSYADNHAAGTYCMLNLKKKAVWKTCNIKWVTSNIVPYEA